MEKGRKRKTTVAERLDVIDELNEDGMGVASESDDVILYSKSSHPVTTAVCGGSVMPNLQ